MGDYNFYEYNPSLVWNVLFTVLMGIVVIGQSSLMIHHRTWWFGSTFIVGTICELIGFITRSLSHNDTINMSLYIAQATCLVFAPVFYMAGIYYLMAQFICVYGRRYSFISAKLCSWIFIVTDVIALFLQGGGGSLMASAGNGSGYNVGRGLTIIGLALQVAMMTAFIYLLVHFLCKLHYLRDQTGMIFVPQHYDLRHNTLFKYYPLVIIVAVVLIYVRSVFRLIEFIQPRDGALQSKEINFLILDALMVTLSVLLLTLLHPGRIIGPVKIMNDKKIEKHLYELQFDEGNDKNPFDG